MAVSGRIELFGDAQVQRPIRVHGQHSDRTALFFEEAAEFEDGRVLDGGGDHVPALRAGAQGAVQGGVVALGAAAREDDLLRFGVDQGGGLGPGVIQAPGNLLPEAVGAGRVAPLLPQEGQHRLDHLGRNLGRGIAIEIAERPLVHTGLTYHQYAYKTNRL